MNGRLNSLVRWSCAAATVGVLVAAAYVAGRRSAEPTDRPDNVVLQIPAAPTNDPPPERIEPPVVVRTNYVTNDFRWRQLESEDYPTYIARLRAIGCPEQTIRDIIIADLDKLFAPEMERIHHTDRPVHYWESAEEELANDVDPLEVAAKERELDEKKREVIEALLGVDLVRERLKQQGRKDYYERRLAFLPEAKRDAVRRVLETYDQLEQDIRSKEWATGEPLNAADRETLAALQQEREQAVASLLTPEEQRQYELWLSPTANAVRHDLYGMNATEEEFLTIYELRKAFDEQWAGVDVQMLDAEGRAAYAQAQAALEEQIRARLGEQRYAEYLRGKDEEFHHLRSTTARFKLPPDKAAEVYEIKRTFEQMRQVVEQDPSLTPEQKQAAFETMAQETERAVKQALGEKAFYYYLRRWQPQWIRPPGGLP